MCCTLMGRQEKRRKWGKERGGLEERGPLPKAKRRSLKLASQAMKKAVGEPRWIVLRWSGR